MTLKATVSAVVKNQKLIVCKASDTVEIVLGVLSSNKLTSVPVVTDDGKGFLGFVDLIDLTAFLHKVCTHEEVTRIATSSDIKEDTVEIIHRRNTEFNVEPIVRIIDYSRRNPAIRIGQDNTLGDAIKQFDTFGVKRLAVVDENGRLANILTESTILTYVGDRKNFPQIPPEVASWTVEQLFGKSPLGDKVVTVKSDEKAIDAFIKIAESKIRGIAVVDENDKVISSISSSDLAGIGTWHFVSLLKPVGEFMQHVRETQKKSWPDQLVTCYPEATFESILRTLGEHKLHRIYVVSQESTQPLGIVSYTDLIHALATLC